MSSELCGSQASQHLNLTVTLAKFFFRWALAVRYYWLMCVCVRAFQLELDPQVPTMVRVVWLARQIKCLIGFLGFQLWPPSHDWCCIQCCWVHKSNPTTNYSFKSNRIAYLLTLLKTFVCLKDFFKVQILQVQILPLSSELKSVFAL